jgi:hypothetical protein
VAYAKKDKAERVNDPISLQMSILVGSIDSNRNVRVWDTAVIRVGLIEGQDDFQLKEDNLERRGQEDR